MLFKDYAPQYVREYVDTHSERMGKVAKTQIINKNLIPYFGNMALGEIKRKQMNEFTAASALRVSERTKKMITGKTISNWLAVLVHMLDYAIDCQYIEDRPKAKFPKKKVPKWDRLKKHEFHQLLNAPIDPYWKGMIAFVAVTGLRIAEAKALHWKDVDLISGYMTIWESSPGHQITIFDQTKTGPERKLKISVSAEKIIKQLRRVGSLVFENPLTPGIPRRYTACAKGLTDACKVAGLRRITWHVLRHTFTSLSRDAKIHVSDIQFSLGHSDIRMTQRYMHRDEDMDQKMVDAFDAFLDLESPNILNNTSNLKTSIKTTA